MNPIDMPEPPDPEELPELDQLVLNRPLARRTLTIAFGVIGCALALLTILAVILLIQVGNTADQNREAIKRLDRITHPTKKQFSEDLKAGIQRCLRSPECRKLFPAIHRSRRGTAYVAPQRSTARKANLDRTPGSGVRSPEGQRGTPVSQPSRPVATTNPPRRSRKPAGGSAPPPPPPPQSSGGSPDSAITLTAPVPVALCTPPLARVNCP